MSTQTGGVFPTLAPFAVTETIEHSVVAGVPTARVVYESTSSFAVVSSNQVVEGNSVVTTLSGTVVTNLRSSLGQEVTLGTSIAQVPVPLPPPVVRSNSLAVETRQSYDVTGSTVTSDAANLLPGVDLSSMPVGGGFIAITPTVVVSAWHVRAFLPAGFTTQFRDPSGTLHTSTLLADRLQLGGDLGLFKLAAPIPSSIEPAQVLPADVALKFNSAELAHAIGFINFRQVRLAAGSFRFSGDRFDLQDSGEPSWTEAIGGDSGSSMFIVVKGKAIATAALWNTAEQGTSIHTYLPEVQAFCDHPLSIIDLSEYPNAT